MTQIYTEIPKGDEPLGCQNIIPSFELGIKFSKALSIIDTEIFVRNKLPLHLMQSSQL